MKRIIFCLFLYSLISWGFHQNFNSPSVEAAPSLNSETLDHLEYLVEQYQINLKSQQIEMVQDKCSQILQNEVTNLKTQLNYQQEGYEALIQYTDNSLTFIVDDLRHMQEDASIINLAQVKLNKIKGSLQSSFKVYASALGESLELGERCVTYPQAFVASLHEINNRRQLALTSSQNLLEFIKNDLKGALAEIQERLLLLEH